MPVTPIQIRVTSSPAARQSQAAGVDEAPTYPCSGRCSVPAGRSDAETNTVASPSTRDRTRTRRLIPRPPRTRRHPARPVAGSRDAARSGRRSSPSGSVGSSRSGNALAVCSARADRLASWLRTACLRRWSRSVSRLSCCLRQANSCWVRSLIAEACFFAVLIRASDSSTAASLVFSASAMASLLIRAASAMSASRRSVDSPCAWSPRPAAPRSSAAPPRARPATGSPPARVRPRSSAVPRPPRVRPHDADSQRPAPHSPGPLRPRGRLPGAAHPPADGRRRAVLRPRPWTCRPEPAPHSAASAAADRSRPFRRS